MVSQTKVLALGQVGPALPPASCEALSELVTLSLCDFPMCRMEIRIVAIKEGCHEKSRIGVCETLRAEPWHTVSTQ